MTADENNPIDQALRDEALGLTRLLAKIRVAIALIIVTVGNFGTYHLTHGFADIGAAAATLPIASSVIYFAVSVLIALGTANAKREKLSNAAVRVVATAIAFMDVSLLTVTLCLPLTQLNAKGLQVPQLFAAVLYTLPCMIHSIHLLLGRARLLGAVFSAAGLGLLFFLVPHNEPEALSPVTPFLIATACYLFIVAFCHVNAGRVRALIARSVASGVWRDRLARFLPPEAIATLEREGGIRLGGTKLLAAVLFTDIRGFTAMAEHLEPADVLAFLNDYFRAMVAVVFKHHGTLDKFIGDALMASFPADQGGATSALACAKAMHEQLALFNAERARTGRVAVEMVAAIHYGPVISGWIGSEERPEFTIIGDTVNVAARLEGLAKNLGQDILVSADAVATLAAPLAWLRPLGDHDVKGRQGRLTVFGWSAAAEAAAA